MRQRSLSDLREGAEYKQNTCIHTPIINVTQSHQARHTESILPQVMGMASRVPEYYTYVNDLQLGCCSEVSSHCCAKKASRFYGMTLHSILYVYTFSSCAILSRGERVKMTSPRALRPGRMDRWWCRDTLTEALAATAQGGRTLRLSSSARMGPSRGVGRRDISKFCSCRCLVEQGTCFHVLVGKARYQLRM